MERLLPFDFVRLGRSLFVTGSSGTGKIFIATVIGYHACKNRFKTLHANMSKLLSTLKISKNKGTLEIELRKIERAGQLILDDAFLALLDTKECLHPT